MQECWDDEPKKRPKFSDIASFFKEMLDEDSTVAILSTSNNQPQYCKLSQKMHSAHDIFGLLHTVIYFYVNNVYYALYIYIHLYYTINILLY